MSDNVEWLRERLWLQHTGETLERFRACADELAMLRRAVDVDYVRAAETELAELRDVHSECEANEKHFERVLAELRKEVERLTNANRVLRATEHVNSFPLAVRVQELEQQLAEANKEWRRCAECGYLQKP